MLTGTLTTDQISYFLVLFGGFLSFFSPCVIPLIPIYMSYLAGNTKQEGEDGTITYQRKTVFFHTLFFVLGISFAFFILGMSFTALGTFFKSNQLLFTRIGGVIIIALGLYQVGLLDFKFLQREHKIHLNIGDRKMSPLLALVMGFTFSFAWTPCVGPALSSVLILASSSGNAFTGNLLVLVYTIGFIVPFLLLGLFTTQVLNFLKRHQKFLKYTVKAAGVLLIIIGIMTFTGWMNGISKYLNTFTPPPGSNQNSSISEDISNSDENTNESNQNNTQNTSDIPDRSADEKTDGDNSEQVEEKDTANTSEWDEKETSKTIPAFDFTLTDQYGKEHTLSDYKGKVVFLNFWATWCPPCQKEMPDIEELYQKFNENQDDVIILGVANPVSEEYPNNQDVSKEEVIAFLEEKGYTFPVVFDETGEVLKSYYINAFPTTFMIDRQGNIFGYVPGMLTKDMMLSVIQQTLDSANDTSE